MTTRLHIRRTTRTKHTHTKILYTEFWCRGTIHRVRYGCGRFRHRRRRTTTFHFNHIRHQRTHFRRHTHFDIKQQARARSNHPLYTRHHRHTHGFFGAPRTIGLRENNTLRQPIPHRHRPTRRHTPDIGNDHRICITKFSVATFRIARFAIRSREIRRIRHRPHLPRWPSRFRRRNRHREHTHYQHDNSHQDPAEPRPPSNHLHDAPPRLLRALPALAFFTRAFPFFTHLPFLSTKPFLHFTLDTGFTRGAKGAGGCATTFPPPTSDTLAGTASAGAALLGPLQAAPEHTGRCAGAGKPPSSRASYQLVWLSVSCGRKLSVVVTNASCPDSSTPNARDNGMFASTFIGETASVP